ncbi:MAK10-like protein [Tanacetum coccineum]|uniref:MAK10-like protein n=1 Tax=Tanacetum coccineum TaxID=301880 RepID=A0ABQ4YZW5_9ASTR
MDAHSTDFGDPNQLLKDFLKHMDSLDFDGSITTWEDLTTRFLAQFFPPGRTVKLCNDILMFQQHHGESLLEAWTRFKERTVDQLTGGKLHDRNAKESWALLEDLAVYDNESWNDPRDFTKPVKAIALPQCPDGPHDTQYCMDDLEQVFVKYASLRTDETGGKNGSTFIQGEVPASMEDPGLFTLPCRLGDSKPFDTLADLGSYVNIIPLYLFKKFNIGLLEETDHIFRLADGTKSYPVGIIKEVEVHIGKLKLLISFYVIDMKKDPETPLLVGRGFLATAIEVIDCRMAKIAVEEGIIRSVFEVKGVKLGEEEAPYWTTLGKRESYKTRPRSDGVGAQTLYYARKDFLDCHLPGE